MKEPRMRRAGQVAVLALLLSGGLLVAQQGLTIQPLDVRDTIVFMSFGKALRGTAEAKIEFSKS